MDLESNNYKLFVLVYCKGKILHLSDTSIPYTNLPNVYDLTKETLALLKYLFGLRFKEEQIYELGMETIDINHVNFYTGLVLDYYPESYTDEEPIFIDLDKESDEIKNFVSVFPQLKFDPQLKFTYV